MPNPFSDALTSSLISPHSLAQMQTLLDSLDTQSNSESKAKAKSELLSFYLQSTLQSFLSPTLRLHHLTKPRLPLVRNIHTRTGTWCLVKDDWVLLNDDASAPTHTHAGAQAHPHAHAHQTPIHLRLVCILDLIRTATATDFSTIDIDQRFLSIFRDITLGQEHSLRRQTSNEMK
ncbi:hypothetical protein E4T56_gene3737 [Termitomyces sp. T112]|nr:hypothetical protein E4T56_gene3737 [Termitomyces sp. T112]